MENKEKTPEKTPENINHFLQCTNPEIRKKIFEKTYDNLPLYYVYIFNTTFPGKFKFPVKCLSFLKKETAQDFYEKYKEVHTADGYVLMNPVKEGKINIDIESAEEELLNSGLEYNAIDKDGYGLRNFIKIQQCIKKKKIEKDSNSQ